jgi:nitroreductase
MEVFEAVRTVLAIRKYAERPIPPDVVRKILESAHLTASSRNGQPWHFIAVQDKEALQKLGRALMTGPYTADAPLAVAVGVDRESPYGISDASRAIQSMILTAWAEGVGSNWVGYLNIPEAAELLGVPDSVELVAVIPFGYPVQTTGKGKKQRKPFSEVVSSERFGQPFE